MTRDPTEEDNDVMSLVAKVMALVGGAVGEADDAVFNAMAKFHRETDCGKDGMHWAECSAAVAAMGYGSWESWERIQGILADEASRRLKLVEDAE